MHPVLLQLGPMKLATYGVLVASGYLAGILWLKSQIRWMPGMTEDKFWTLVYALFFGALAGGKLLYVLVEWPRFAADPGAILRDFRYGFVFFGGLLGSMAMGVWATRRTGLPYFATADYFGVALPLGHTLGRLGCLGAGCCYGRPTSLPWGVRLGGLGSSTPEAFWGVPLHPTQLYESLTDAGIALALGLWLLPKVKRKEARPGAVFATYVLLYSAGRFVNEFFRGDDRGWSFLGLWISQWVALACIFAAVAWLATRPRESAQAR